MQLLRELVDHGSAVKPLSVESIYLVIRDRITLIDYKPGQKVSESMLADEFQVSRTPIRSILSRLEAEGLVRVHHGAGTFVTDIDINQMEAVYQLRRELALVMARMEWHRPPKRLFTTLAAAVTQLRQLENSAKSKRKFAEINQQVFEQIHSLVDNIPFREIITRLFYQTARVWIAWMPDHTIRKEAEAFADEIEQLISILELGDMETVAHLYRCHIAFGFERLAGYAEAHGIQSSTQFKRSNTPIHDGVKVQPRALAAPRDPS